MSSGPKSRQRNGPTTGSRRNPERNGDNRRLSPYTELVNAPETGSVPGGPKRSRALRLLFGVGGLLFVIAGVMAMYFVVKAGQSLVRVTSELASGTELDSIVVVGKWRPHPVPIPKSGTTAGVRPKSAHGADRMGDFQFRSDGTYLLEGTIKTEGTYRVEVNELFLTPKRVGGHAPLYTYAEQAPIDISPDGKSFFVPQWNIRWDKADR